MFDVERYPIIYSVCNRMSYRVNYNFYQDVHYCWCAKEFDCRTQPTTSNPKTIINTYLQQCITGDLHMHVIKDQMIGILKGATYMLDNDKITADTFDIITNMLYTADFKCFMPVLYVIDARKVGAARIQQVAPSKTASLTSEEYLITDLAKDEFAVINFEELLGNINGIVICEELVRAIAEDVI